MNNYPIKNRAAQILLGAVFVLVSASAGVAQTTTSHPKVQPSSDPPPSQNAPLTNSKQDPETDFGSPDAEMRAKLILKEEKKRYDENQARAKEVSDLAGELANSYTQRKSFTSEDVKKLERIEKLTKRIRNEAGGSDSEPDADIRDIPASMEETLKRTSDMAEELRKMVENTPRNVVSAAVIDQANHLIGLVQHLRESGR